MSVRLSILLLAAMVAGTANAREVNIESKIIRGHEYIIAWTSGVMLEGGAVMSEADDGVALSMLHSASCTNHAPTVVTQYVDRVVTQECQRQHWPEPGQSAPLPMFPTPWPTNITVPYYYTVTTQCQNVVGSNDTVTVHMKDAASGEWISFPLFKEVVTNDVGVEK